MKIINVTPEMTVLPLGRLGENETTQFIFDVSDWLEEYPGGTIGLAHQLPHTKVSYPCAIVSEGDGKYSWTITSAELTKEGWGKSELILTKSSKVKKGKVYKTLIGEALDGDADPPEEWEGFITQVTELKEAAEDAAEDAADARDAVQDMSVAAITLLPGTSATVTKTVDPVTGAVTLTFGIPKGLPGNETIDDTAGAGDTDKVWSANKTVHLAPKNAPEFYNSMSLGRSTGVSDKRTGNKSTAFGHNVIAQGDYSNVTGEKTIGMSNSGHVFGEYNVPEAEEWVAGKQYHEGDIKVRYVTAAGEIRSILYFKCNTDHTSSNTEANDSAYWDGVFRRDLKYVEIVGNGYEEIDDQTLISTEHRSNARTLDWDGNERLKGDLYVGCNTDSSGGTKVAKLTDLPVIATTTETQAIITEYAG